MKELIRQFLLQKEYTKLYQELSRLNSADLAELLEELKSEDAMIVFRLLAKEQAAEVFSYMESEVQERFVTLFTDQEMQEVMSRLAMDDAVDFLEEMPAGLVKKILKNTSIIQRKQINELLQYPEDSAGSIMTTEYVDLKADMTVEEAFQRIRKTGLHKETVYTCYVLNSARVLQGIVTVKEMLLSDYTNKISDIMETNLITVSTLEDQESVARIFDKYDLLALPVVDTEKRLVGIITIDDAMEVLQEENQEDFELMAAVSPHEESYFKTSIFEHAKHRIAWLLILMLSATVTGTIITHYETAFAAMPILVAFIPMLMDTGGNCGSQSSTLIIRGLAMDEIHRTDLLKVIFKEGRIAMIVGVTLGFINGLRIFIQYHNLLLAIVVGITLFATVLLSKLLGCTLPILAKTCHLDPAIMAAPLITTIVDTCSVLIYFNVAMRIMNL